MCRTYTEDVKSQFGARIFFSMLWTPFTLCSHAASTKHDQTKYSMQVIRAGHTPVAGLGTI